MGGEDVFGVLGGHPVSIECKSVQSCVIAKWYDQAQSHCGTAIPLVVVHIANKNSKGDLAVISLRDLITLTGGKS